MSMDTQEAIAVASKHLRQLPGRVLDILDISKPATVAGTINLSKIASKLSPLIGNLIEFNAVEFLNTFPEFKDYGKWQRQDPGFPDAVFHGAIDPAPGFEIKAWFPMATEITARFKDSQDHFIQDQTYVSMLAWLPEFVIFGKPKIIDIVIVSGASVAKARDDHYHNLPDYLVLEPEDTSKRAANIQQTNTSGFKFQGTPEQFAAAQKIVSKWGPDGGRYRTGPEYQAKMRTLLNQFKYREDTNFAKMDRIVHAEIEDFKTRVYNTEYRGMTVLEWKELLSRGSESDLANALIKHLGVLK